MGNHPFLRTAIFFVFLVSFHCIGNANSPNLFNVSKPKTNFTFGPKASFHFNKLHFNRNFTSSFEPGFEGDSSSDLEIDFTYNLSCSTHSDMQNSIYC